MEKKKFTYLFRRYVNNQATEKEIKALMRMVKSGKYDEWIKKRIDRGLEGDVMQSNKSDTDMPARKADEILQHILKPAPQKTAGKPKERPSSPRYSYPKSTTGWKWVAAAAVILLAGFSWVYLERSAGDRDTDELPETAMQEIITNRGERTSLILADGSRVTLNAESRLQVPMDYGQRSRTLILDGEAFFEVEHDPGRPFRVYTGDHVYTEVLGTQFNVRSYEASGANGEVDVVVAEGRVRLGSEDQSQPNSVEICAGQKGAIGAAGTISVSGIPGAALDRYLGWVDGRLVFDDQPFEEIITELERWYDIEITVTDPRLLQRRMSATFEGDPLSEVLQIISRALQIDFTQEKRKVRFFIKSGTQ